MVAMGANAFENPLRDMLVAHACLAEKSLAANVIALMFMTT